VLKTSKENFFIFHFSSLCDGVSNLQCRLSLSTISLSLVWSFLNVILYVSFVFVLFSCLGKDPCTCIAFWCNHVSFNKQINLQRLLLS